ncbi:scavenger receptor cysteine-rich type 1 protein M160-like [Mytilus edulis]|uniref:scavenger receptor cysteine-rich type 1 protein M160-like n=1 Tax=Mytilus edulis TaxID=6550 RepID=UPI0039EF5746
MPENSVAEYCPPLKSDLELVNGMLKIFYNGVWGTVCDDSFDDIDAQVACRQLGYNNGIFIGVKDTYPKGTIWLDDVDCSGAEKKLSHCTHAGWGVENCFRGENVKIKCNNASEGDLRHSSDKLEILHNNEWGTVCSSNFNKIEAEVACMQLGYRNGSVLENTIATGTSKIWLNILACDGNESKLMDCPHSDWDTDTCSHGNVVGIRCSEGQGDIRLNSSRLEIYYNGTWGTVSSPNFDDIDATVACRQLGYNYGMSLGNNVDAGTGRIWIYQMNCIGNERTLTDCSHSNWGLSYYSHSSDVGIKCFNGNEGDLHIRTNAGELKIFHNNEWGSVCSYDFDNIDATVACRQLGYRLGHQHGAITYYYGKIWLSKVNCTGGERHLASCQHATWGKHYCSNGVTITCNNNTFDLGDIRINSSRLEIFHDFEWGTVYSGNFDDYAATVACRQLEYSSGISLGNIVRSGRGKIWLDDIKCTGEESKLTDCSIEKWGAKYRSHSDDVGILCSNDSTIVDGRWLSWATWNECSKSCGNGIRTRSRTCNNPSPSNGGLPCKGDTLEAQLCNKMSCPVVNGNWSVWTQWTDCSMSCGNGFQTRSRRCNDPSLSNIRFSCHGDTLEAQLCNKIECPVDGSWSPWSIWNTCNVTCGGGTQWRSRHCDNPSPLYGGINCGTDSYDFIDCNTDNCRVDGSWGPWSIWNTCNVTCGGGTQWRSRHCDNPTPLYGGSDCGTDNYDFNNCNTENCPGLESSEERIGMYFSHVGVGAGCIVVTVVCVLVCKYVASSRRTQNKDNSYTTTLSTSRRAEIPGRSDDCVVYHNDGHDDDYKDEGLMYETLE